MNLLLRSAKNVGVEKEIKHVIIHIVDGFNGFLRSGSLRHLRALLRHIPRFRYQLSDELNPRVLGIPPKLRGNVDARFRNWASIKRENALKYNIFRPGEGAREGTGGVAKLRERIPRDGTGNSAHSWRSHPISDTRCVPKKSISHPATNHGIRTKGPGSEIIIYLAEEESSGEWRRLGYSTRSRKAASTHRFIDIIQRFSRNKDQARSFNCPADLLPPRTARAIRLYTSAVLFHFITQSTLNNVILNTLRCILCFYLVRPSRLPE